MVTPSTIIRNITVNNERDSISERICLSVVASQCVSCNKVKVSVVPRRHVAVVSTKSKSLDDCSCSKLRILSTKASDTRCPTISYERLFSNRHGRANVSVRSRPSNVRVTGAERAQRGTQFSIEVP